MSEKETTEPNSAPKTTNNNNNINQLNNTKKRKKAAKPPLGKSAKKKGSRKIKLTLHQRTKLLKPAEKSKKSVNGQQKSPKLKEEGGEERRAIDDLLGEDLEIEVGGGSNLLKMYNMGASVSKRGSRFSKQESRSNYISKTPTSKGVGVQRPKFNKSGDLETPRSLSPTTKRVVAHFDKTDGWKGSEKSKKQKFYKTTTAKKGKRVGNISPDQPGMSPKKIISGARLRRKMNVIERNIEMVKEANKKAIGPYIMSKHVKGETDKKLRSLMLSYKRYSIKDSEKEASKIQNTFRRLSPIKNGNKETGRRGPGRNHSKNDENQIQYSLVNPLTYQLMVEDLVDRRAKSSQYYQRKRLKALKRQQRSIVVKKKLGGGNGSRGHLSIAKEYGRDQDGGNVMVWSKRRSRALKRVISSYSQEGGEGTRKRRRRPRTTSSVYIHASGGPNISRNGGGEAQFITINTLANMSAIDNLDENQTNFIKNSIRSFAFMTPQAKKYFSFKKVRRKPNFGPGVDSEQYNREQGPRTSPKNTRKSHKRLGLGSNNMVPDIRTGRRRRLLRTPGESRLAGGGRQRGYYNQEVFNHPSSSVGAQMGGLRPSTASQGKSVEKNQLKKLLENGLTLKQIQQIRREGYTLKELLMMSDTHPGVLIDTKQAAHPKLKITQKRLGLSLGTQGGEQKQGYRSSSEQKQIHGGDSPSLKRGGVIKSKFPQSLHLDSKKLFLLDYMKQKGGYPPRNKKRKSRSQYIGRRNKGGMNRNQKSGPSKKGVLGFLKAEDVGDNGLRSSYDGPFNVKVVHQDRSVLRRTAPIQTSGDEAGFTLRDVGYRDDLIDIMMVQKRKVCSLSRFLKRRVGLSRTQERLNQYLKSKKKQRISKNKSRNAHL